MTTISGPNATVTVEEKSVTIQHKLTRRKKTIAYADIGGVTIKEGNWLTRPKLFVLTKTEVAFATSGVKVLQRAVDPDEWYVVVGVGQDAAFEALRSEICRRAGVARGLLPSQSPPAPWSIGDGVMVQWSDGNRYPARVNAVDAARALVAFPSGQQHWVPNEHLSRSS